MRRRGTQTVFASVLGCCFVLMGAGTAQARDTVVRSFDGTPIVTHFFPAEGLKPGQRAPTVLVGHGFGLVGQTDPDADSEEIFGSVGIGPIRKAGFNILTWDARGFGGSGGQVELNHPKFEGRDVQALLDYVARQREALLDGPGDPRSGMAGSSYGGIIQLVAAAIDRRIDAIVPNIAPNSYLTTLYPDETVKAGWGLLLAGAAQTSLPLGLLSPAGPQLGNLNPNIYRAIAEGSVTGKFSPRVRSFFAERGPNRVVSRIRVPTLFTQGTADTLFPLDEAARNHAAVARNGAPTKMMWFCGGHGTCSGENGPSGRLEEATIEWLERWVKRDTSVDTGPAFEWLADNESSWRARSRFPARAGGRLRGEGSGLLPIGPTSPVTGGGALIAATEALDAVNVDIRPPVRGADVLGAPRVKLAYSGTAAPAATHLFAQLVDRDTGRVVHNQVTPIPVTLDGRRRSVSRELEPVASRASADSRYRVQIAGGTTVYGPQRSLGAANLHRVDASLPVAQAAAASGDAGAAAEDGEPGTDRPLGATADDEPSADAGTAGATGSGSSGEDGGGLPVTGLQLLALGILGAALLSTGLVLRRRGAAQRRSVRPGRP